MVERRPPPLHLSEHRDWVSIPAARQWETSPLFNGENGLHLYRAFLTTSHSKRFTIPPHIHPFMHTFTHRRRDCRRASGAVRVRCLTQGHLDTWDRTSNFFGSQPTPLYLLSHMPPLLRRVSCWGDVCIELCP